jgi:transcriptional regulator with XRE-family HTH domain
MIRNERQYRVTYRQRQLLAGALEEVIARREHELSEAAGSVGQDDLLSFELEQASIEGQLTDLDVQLHEYEQLRAGTLQRAHITSLDQLPAALVQARIAAGLTQRALAERLGLKEQQIQRYEADGYASASLTRLEEVRTALGVELEAGIQFEATDTAISQLKRRLRQLGLGRSIIDKRIMRDVGELASPAKVLAAAERASRLLGLSVQDLLSSSAPLPELATNARFKAPANAAVKSLDAYTRYAEGLADIVLKATAGMPKPQLPTTAQTLCEELSALVAPDARTSQALFAAAVRYLFMHGVLVMGLRDPGAFHGACFTAEDRSVIVLKQTTDSPAKWLHDLLHETGHLRDDDRAQPRSWVELGEVHAWSSDPAEQVANAFAADVLFQGRAAPVVEACLTRSRGSIELLKRTVPEVAQAAAVPVDVLANYVAYQLSAQGTNWWPTAATFQLVGTPWRTVTDMLIEHLDFTILNSVERAALLDALAA